MTQRLDPYPSKRIWPASGFSETGAPDGRALRWWPPPLKGLGLRTELLAKGPKMRIQESTRLPLALSLIGLVVASCGRGASATDAGLTGKGGAAGFGGGVIASGGSTGSGGVAGFGGMTVTGGVIASGGSMGSGGVVGLGGMTGTSGTSVGHYVVSADGLTVTDTTTGLVWQRDVAHSRPGCQYSPLCNLFEAKAYCASLALDGPGWRLPTEDELVSIVDTAVGSAPKIDQTAFPYTPPEGFWTSSPAADSSGFVCFVHFGYGGTGSANPVVFFKVRCVR